MKNISKNLAKNSVFYPSLRQFWFDLMKLSARLRTKKMHQKYMKKIKLFPVSCISVADIVVLMVG